MSGRRGTAADGGEVDAYSLAPLLPGLELYIRSLLCYDFCQDPGHSLKSLLVSIV